MRALRNSKTWLLLALNALLILAGAPAFASQCCCAHHISHAIATLPKASAPKLQAARFLFSATTFLAPSALDNKRAAGRSPPLV